MRLQLDLAAIAGVQTFGDYLVFHPHLHVLSASGLFDQTGLFHLLPATSTKSLDALGERSKRCKIKLVLMVIIGMV